MMNNNIDLLTDITGLGNAILLAVLSLTLAIYLWLIGYRREPLAVVLGFILPAGIIGVLKIGFYICDTNLWGIVSPSGHAAISIGVLGIAALILAKICKGVWRAIIPISLIILAFVIAISRSILGMHTDGDVIFGSLIGFATVIAIAKLVLSYRLKNAVSGAGGKKKANPAIIALLVLIAVISCYEIKMPSEKVMSSIAKQIRANLPLCN